MAIVGIDVGTQSLKVVITDDELGVRARASRSYSVRTPQPGWAEQDPHDWERALGPAVAEALARGRVAPDEVQAIGVSGQLDGCLGVTAEGEPVTPCIIWFDRRASELIPAWLTGDGADEFLQRTGVIADATHMAPKIRWLESHAAGAVRYHQPVSYLVERLTGSYVFDHGLASTTMLYALAPRDFDDDLLERFAIARDRLPAIADACDTAGELSVHGAGVTGLRPGTPVAVGTGDDFATPLGAGLVGPGTLACVLGTGEVVGALSESAVLDRRGLVETHCYANQCFFIENPGWLSGGAMAWLSRLLAERDFSALDAAAAAAP
ncbi:MAG: FGGY family carbohydrate kinase, partial [Myxococcota bacterium]